MRHVFQTGLELALLKDELITHFQKLPPANTPICFREAVIGLGSHAKGQVSDSSVLSVRGRGTFAPESKYRRYLDYIRWNLTCGAKEFCGSVLQWNVIAPSMTYGIHSIDGPARWGQPVDGGKAVFEGLEERMSS
ncbi:MAG: hypothetical protein J3R72DRAFT_427287 [Linnemannia gamsii]|nr:MAG: hypothetical protein J3R72DRAFT_427287 [Linnemannia gamsii]